MTNRYAPWAKLTRPTLAARRARARLSRAVAVICAVAAAAMAVTLLDLLVATESVVVASRTLHRGDVIGVEDVMVVEAPRSPVTEHAFSETSEAVGRVAQSDIGARQPLFPANARDAPVVPTGRTVLEVVVANDASALVAGDTVRLVSAVGCEDTPGPGVSDVAGDASGPVPEGRASPCTLAEDALVMKRPVKDENGAGTAVIPLAMTPEAALAVMDSAQLGAIVAVTR
ncbi:SAF domain-containing protein [Bifidobacterium aesculapii]|uniref:SAF domain-containing protein n=1 Tax=Bifidobacterium aesculapii TaxID=1329411 RepID=UPI0006E31C93|nr:SAF domain-containing protein [Bifidobacterium aesculapii]